MTDKELHKLKRSELLDVLFYMRKELDELQAECDRLRKQIETSENNREILMKIFDAVCPGEKPIEENETEKETAT